MGTHRDLVLKGLLDILPLHLLGSRNESTLRSPFISAKNNALNDFNRLESILLCDTLQIPQEELLNGWRFTERMQVRFGRR
jgi:hypothetical protein